MPTTNFGGQNFGYQIWFCNRLFMCIILQSAHALLQLSILNFYSGSLDLHSSDSETLSANCLFFRTASRWRDGRRGWDAGGDRGGANRRHGGRGGCDRRGDNGGGDWGGDGCGRGCSWAIMQGTFPLLSITRIDLMGDGFRERGPCLLVKHCQSNGNLTSLKTILSNL